MNIAYICADEGIDVNGDCGSGPHIRGSIRGLRERGHSVTLFFQRESRSPDRSGADNVVHIPLRPAAAGARRRLRAVPGLRWIDRLPVLPSFEQLAHNRDVRAALEERHRRARFDLIFERSSLWHNAGLQMAKAWNIPYLLEVHSPEADQRRLFQRTFLWTAAKQMELHSWRNADIVAPVSSELADLLIRHGVRRDKILLLPCAVSPKEFGGFGDRRSARRRLGIPEDRFLIGFMGSFKPWHGTELLPAILEKLRDGLPRPHLLLVGDGPARPALLSALEACGLASYYTWAGPVSHCAVPGILRSLDTALLLNHSTAFSYMSPIKLFEYMASGLIVVASRLGPHPEIVEHGRTGLLAAAGDPQDFARQIMWVRDNPSRAAEIGRHALERVLEEHTWQKNAEKIEARLGWTAVVA